MDVIINLLISVIPVILGVAAIWRRVDPIRQALAETADTLHVITAALEDRQITDLERQKIIAEARQMALAWKRIFSGGRK